MPLLYKGLLGFAVFAALPIWRSGWGDGHSLYYIMYHASREKHIPLQQAVGHYAQFRKAGGIDHASGGPCTTVEKWA